VTTSRSPRPALLRERLLTELRAFVEDNYLYLRPELELQDTDRLLELRIMDSLGFVELVEEVQTRYAISVATSTSPRRTSARSRRSPIYVGRKRAP